MLRCFMIAATALLASPHGFAQGVASVDLLNPEETTGTIPPNFRIVDVYVDVLLTDYWTAAGIRATTENGATLNYFDLDLNTPEPSLFNGGTANKFYTMLSKPRGRDANNRFTNAAAAAAGAYDPTSPTPVILPGELNVAYFGNIGGTVPPPSVDGYIARISVDISALSEIPGYPISDYANWGAGAIAPPGAFVVLRSEPHSAVFGTAIATDDVPHLSGLNWAMYYIPEPASLALLTIGGLGALRRR